VPRRVLSPVLWLERHISEHPGRLVLSSLGMLLVSVTLLAMAVWITVGASHAADIKVCGAVNELSRKIYVTLADFGVPEYRRAKFRPTDDCGDLP
jgi:hypothetical protein